MGNKPLAEIAAFGRTMAMLEAILERPARLAVDHGPDTGRHRRGDVSAIARELDIPVSTAHRQVATLVAEGLLRPVGRGRHVAGPRLQRLAELFDLRQLVASVAFEPLDALASRTHSIAQLGSLEDDMVTYRIKTGYNASRLFTKVGMQLEAYCSGIGKVLLAHMPEAVQRRYLGEGPFPQLTERTITDPVRLAGEFALIRERGFAIDDEEIAPGLRCFAVPVRGPQGDVVAAISLSTQRGGRAVRDRSDAQLVDLVRAAARQIEDTAFGPSRNARSAAPGSRTEGED